MFRSVDSETLIGICPFCNSSEAFKFREGETWMFLCHDCQRYMNFERTGIKDEPIISTNQGLNYSSILSLCTMVSKLDSNHKFRRYCEYRKIPLDRVYYTDRFDELSNYAETPVKDKERLVLPFFDEEGKLFGIQGRSLDKDQIRYITLMFDKDKPKLFGLNTVDTSKQFFVVEGPIDSLFVTNCLSMAGADVSLNKYISNAVIVFDNEPRNKQITAKVKKYLEEGYRVVIWPDSLKEKDINDMVLKGHDVNKLLTENIYNGLSGILKLNEWKR